MDDTTLQFAREHSHEDTAQLLLRAARYPHIDMRAAAQQIEGLRMAADKWPSLLDNSAYLFPPHLNCEQSSSDATARYRAEQLIPVGARVADLTGGMGIDTLWMARRAAAVTYVERDGNLCALMRHNLQVMGVDNVVCQQADSMEWLAGENRQFDMIYLDPARRSGGRRVFAFEDCTPNLLEHIDLLRLRCGRLVVKSSPMIDLRQAQRQLSLVEEIHIVAVQGECKEVVFVCGSHQGEPLIKCVNLTSRTCQTNTFSFTWADEASCEAHLCSKSGSYLYEPHAALMKASAYKLIAQRYDMAQLDVNSHLYTADRLVGDFPGRVFRVAQEVRLRRPVLHGLLPDGRVHVVTRNYPVAAADLQRQLGLSEGGDRYLIATTVAGQRCGFLCERLS